MKTKEQKLNSHFKVLHNELLAKNEYVLADELSSIYYETQTLYYVSGMDFIKNLYKL